jgi:hypothetical protein
MREDEGGLTANEVCHLIAARNSCSISELIRGWFKLILSNLRLSTYTSSTSSMKYHVSFPDICQEALRTSCSDSSRE